MHIMSLYLFIFLFYFILSYYVMIMIITCTMQDHQPHLNKNFRMPPTPWAENQNENEEEEYDHIAKMHAHKRSIRVSICACWRSSQSTTHRREVRKGIFSPTCPRLWFIIRGTVKKDHCLGHPSRGFLRYIHIVRQLQFPRTNLQCMALVRRRYSRMTVQSTLQICSMGTSISDASATSNSSQW
jgi:hypothetical protein